MLACFRLVSHGEEYFLWKSYLLAKERKKKMWCVKSINSNLESNSSYVWLEKEKVVAFVIGLWAM